MVNTYLGMRTYFSYLRLICSDNLAWLKSGNHAYIKQAQFIMHFKLLEQPRLGRCQAIGSLQAMAGGVIYRQNLVPPKQT